MNTIEIQRNDTQHVVNSMFKTDADLQACKTFSADTMVFFVDNNGQEMMVTKEMIELSLSELRAAC